MRWSMRGSTRMWVVAVALWMAGCGGGGSATFECNPECPAGYRCTETGCVSDSAAADLAVTSVDLAGTCAPACGGPTPHCKGGLCVPCLTDEHCPLGQVCRGSGAATVCLPGCAGDGRCPGGLVCCAGACTDTQKDASNCGACGKACAAPHAASSCVGGACTVGKCASAWGDCNADPSDGCEANLHQDAAHCGACGAACSADNAIPACGLGGCYLAACRYGFEDCDSQVANGCEIAVLADPKNCGACGKACAAVSRANVACTVGACSIASCSVGFGDCNGNYNDGCEIALSSDKSNCGRCGLACLPDQICKAGECDCPVCTFPNAKAACSGRRCVIDSCLPGFADCDGSTVNGCEMPIASNARNCGACGVVCAQGLICQNGSCTCPQCNIPNAKTACVNNVCTLASCLPGFADCDGVAMNGCEVATDGDAKNCGGCGKACGGQTPYCVGGMCSQGGLHCADILKANANAKSGVYTIDPDGAGGAAPFSAYCDMTTAGGGWTLLLNLDTSDGHVMWWGEALWEDGNPWGDVNTPFDGDHKSPAWTLYSGTTEVLLVVHEQGAIKGWRRFHKIDGRTLYQYYQDNTDNTVLGDQSLAADTANIAYAQEALVRSSTKLYVNHCIQQQGGRCTSGAGALGCDGNRIGSNEAIPKNNDGGGLGNWTDMATCCVGYGTPASQKTCTGGTFRTTSEAQAGWSTCWASGNKAGAFGTDTWLPWNDACRDANCDASNWSGGNGWNYDYALLLSLTPSRPRPAARWQESW